jgi:hypothetical protein
MDIWILLADTRKKLLWLWMGFSVFIIGLFLFMTFVGKFEFEDVTTAAWIWVLGSLLPMLALLFIGVSMNPQPSKVIKKAAFQLVFYGALCYLLLVLVTLFGMQAWLVANTEGGISDYFQLSYTWLLPFQAILLVGAWILYFRKTILAQPNEKILLEYAQKKADYAQRYGNRPQQVAFDLLLKNDYPSVFEQLKSNLTDRDDKNTALILQGQYTELTEKSGFNTIEPAEAQRELNRITLALVDTFEKL